MTAVVLGGNRFIECDAVLGHEGQPILQVRFAPLRVSLTTPPLRSGRSIYIDDGTRDHAPGVRVIQSPISFAIFWDEYALVLATLLEPHTAHLRVDLRPLGMLIYDDIDGLHIGSNVFSGNVVDHAATAINLGD